MIPRSQIVLVAAIAVAGLVSALSSRLDPYFALIISNIGINVILAVSLNLINGYTGQFSLGHAGFMAVGAYTAAAITMFGAPKFAPALTQGAGIHALFPHALVGGGLALFYYAKREQKRHAQVEEFFAAFTHDAKTALASLRLQAESLKEDFGATPKQLVAAE